MKLSFLFRLALRLVFLAWFSLVQVLDIKRQQFKRREMKSLGARETFLELFLRSEESSTFSRQELVTEVKQIMYAATDTSMQLLCAFLVTMTIHRDVQRNIQKELDGIFGEDHTRPVQPADLPGMQYLERVIQEVLRVFPVVSALGREATADVTLPSGHVIPKGCGVLVAPYLIQSNARWFPEPLRFDPDRFLPDSRVGRHPFAFVPFSAGTRSCLGQRYAMMSAKTVAATLLRKFSFLPDPNGPKTIQDIQLSAGMTMSLTNGANIRLERRKHRW